MIPRLRRYKPDLHGFGSPYDSFRYTLSDDARNLTSAETLVAIHVEGVKDRPMGTSMTLSVIEDAHPDGILIPLSSTDVDTAHVDAVVSELPSAAMGALYSTSDGTLQGSRTRIRQENNIFAVNQTRSQYLSRILRVSSFFGEVLSSDYNPINVLGPPDCSTYGECNQDAAWVSDVSLYPPLGSRVAHAGLLAIVNATHPKEGSVTLKYAPTFRDSPTTGELVRCAFDEEAPSDRSYPSDCSLTAAPSDGGSVVRTVGRSEINGVRAAVWCPRQMSYAGNKTQTGGGKFGPEFRFE